MPSSPVRIAATRMPSHPINSAVPASSPSMRRAIRSSGSVVTTQIWVRVPPSGATSQASHLTVGGVDDARNRTRYRQLDVA